MREFGELPRHADRLPGGVAGAIGHCAGPRRSTGVCHTRKQLEDSSSCRSGLNDSTNGCPTPQWYPARWPTTSSRWVRPARATGVSKMDGDSARRATASGTHEGALNLLFSGHGHAPGIGAGRTQRASGGRQPHGPDHLPTRLGPPRGRHTRSARLASPALFQFSAPSGAQCESRRGRHPSRPACTSSSVGFGWQASFLRRRAIRHTRTLTEPAKAAPPTLQRSESRH